MILLRVWAWWADRFVGWATGNRPPSKTERLSIEERIERLNAERAARLGSRRDD